MRNIDNTTPNKIATKVTTLDFLGSFCRAHLKPDAAPNVAILADFSLNLMRDLSVAEGQALTVALPPESLRVFAAHERRRRHDTASARPLAPASRATSG